MSLDWCQCFLGIYIYKCTMSKLELKIVHFCKFSMPLWPLMDVTGFICGEKMDRLSKLAVGKLIRVSLRRPSWQKVASLTKKVFVFFWVVRLFCLLPRILFQDHISGIYIIKAFEISEHQFGWPTVARYLAASTTLLYNIAKDTIII